MRTVIKAQVDHASSVRAYESAQKARGPEADVATRKRALRHAMASTALEGGEMDAELAAISSRYASGEINLAEYERLSDAYLEKYREA